MLSVLLPVYNYDVRSLVGDLAKQCLEAGIAFEILCFDDHSPAEIDRKNQKVIQLEGVTYFRLEKNVGRSKIRNLLAQAAKYDHLLFLDCDSGLMRENFIQQYVGQIGQSAVICGGRNYEAQPPADQQFYFHWKYGSRREVRSASERSEAPHAGFMSNNFMVDKKVLLDIPFDETLLQYGHEDTLWGEMLQRKDIPIKHIDNPILHLGLDPAQQFINKTKAALENLVQLEKTGKPVNVRLHKVARLGRKLGLSAMVKLIGQPLLSGLESNFTSKYPSLRLFDIYRLIYLSKIQ